MKSKRAKRPVTPSTAPVWISIALLLATFAVYAQVRNHGFINYDDPVYVTGNAHVRAGVTWDGVVWAFTSAHDANWIPLTWISHMLDCQLFGVRSGPQHLTNVVLHGVSAALLFLLLLRMTGAFWRSAFVAFVFALHPLHVESVAWIAERKDVLSGFFWFATLWAYLRYVNRRTLARYAVIVVLFCCGLLSKPMAVTLPVVLLLLDYWPLRRMQMRGAVTEKIPLFALSAAASVVTYLVQKHAGTVSSFADVSFFYRVENALVSYLLYLAKFLWPSGLAVFYPLTVPLPWWQWIAAALLLAAATVVTWRMRRERPYLITGWLWYICTLLPVIGLIQAGLQARADRYMYVPMVGLAIMLSWGIAEVVEHRARFRFAAGAAGAAVCVVLAVASSINLQYWADSITLFRHAVEVTDGNYVAYNNLGAALKDAGEPAEAVAAFQSAVTIRPSDHQAQDNLGEAFMDMGRVEDAIPHLEEALRLQPDFAKAHIDLASAMVRSGRLDEAAAQYRLALQIQPDSVEAQYGLGGLLARQGRLSEAMPYLEKALPPMTESVRSRPDDATGHYNLGTLLALMGRTGDAIPEFAEAVRLQPSDPAAHFNLGTALASRGRLDEAINEFNAALQLNPDYTNARISLEQALREKSRH